MALSRPAGPPPQITASVVTEPSGMTTSLTSTMSVGADCNRRVGRDEIRHDFRVGNRALLVPVEKAFVFPTVKDSSTIKNAALIISLRPMMASLFIMMASLHQESRSQERRRKEKIGEAQADVWRFPARATRRPTLIFVGHALSGCFCKCSTRAPSLQNNGVPPCSPFAACGTNRCLCKTTDIPIIFS